MTSNISTIPLDFNTQLYCLDTSILPLDQCPGICVNPDVSGYPAVISFIAASVVTGLAMVWLPDAHDRRHQFYLHYIQSFSRIVSAFVFLFNRKINTYDVYLIVLLVLGSETTAFVGAASLLHIVEYPFHLGVVKPLGSIILVIVMATLASPNHEWLQKTAVQVAGALGQNFQSVRGSQPACDFTFNKLFFIPLSFLTAICFLSVLCSRTSIFARLVKMMPDFGHKTVNKVRILWSIYIVLIDIVWIILVYFFIRSYMNVPSITILNKDLVTKITPSQLFSIFLSATSLVPPLKHALSKVKKFLEWDGEETRKAIKELYGVDESDDSSNEKNTNNQSDDSLNNGVQYGNDGQYGQYGNNGQYGNDGMV
ncbi:hypothetical protein C8J56DRAFT_1025204 [Mycena floridula]|nr:hypothetical protein C8J56DRAFT_1025204 [Mycena floridula]